MADEKGNAVAKKYNFLNSLKAQTIDEFVSRGKLLSDPSDEHPRVETPQTKAIQAAFVDGRKIELNENSPANRIRAIQDGLIALGFLKEVSDPTYKWVHEQGLVRYPGFADGKRLIASSDMGKLSSALYGAVGEFQRSLGVLRCTSVLDKYTGYALASALSFQHLGYNEADEMATRDVVRMMTEEGSLSNDAVFALNPRLVDELEQIERGARSPASIFGGESTKQRNFNK